MNRIITLCLLGLLVLSCEQPTSENIQETTSTPHDFMFMQRAYPSGQIKTDAYAKAIAWKKQQEQRNPAAGIWEFTGPVNIGGRITDIEIPSGQSQTYYVGAASGGIFKSTNAGNTWVPIFDGVGSLSIGDMEISRNDNNIIWVGTGEVNAGGGSLAYDGDGVYKSTNGGTTWESKGLPDVGSIGKVLIDPNDDDTIFVGAMGPLFRDDNNRGVYRSTDGGNTWSQVLFVSNITGVIDMANHPTNSDIIYATTWERIRRPDNRIYGGDTSRIYRSTDGGTTWSELTVGLPSAGVDKGRISIDISRSNPNVLYARYADSFGSIHGVFRTSNGGDVWTEVNSSQLTNVGFHWWFRGIYVDPSDENTIYNVDFVIEKSTDGGNNWFTAFPNVHVDQHAMAFNENVAGEVLAGNDGGFYKSSDAGVSSTKDLTLPITQFYRYHVDAQNGNRLYGGTQDNSTMRTTTGGLNDWQIIFGGDGFQPLVDPTNSSVIYALSQRGNLGKSIDDGASFNGATNGITGSDRNNWDTPIAFDPANSQTLFYGTQRLYKTTDAAANWSAISPDLTNGPGSGNLTFGTIISISISPLDSNRIYVGTDDGNIATTPDGGTTWNNVSGSLPNRWVTSVFASPTDADRVYATFSGYRFGEDNGHVYRSDNAGSTWTDIGTSLPDIPVNDVLVDRFDNLFIATDVGVLGSNDDGVTWQVLGNNLPAVVATDMHIDEPNDLLYVGTYGRSSYKLELSSTVLGIENNVLASEITMYPNPARDQVNIALENSSSITVQIFDQMGREIKIQNFSGKTHKMSLEGISSGVYFVTISSGSAKASKKLIIQ